MSIPAAPPKPSAIIGLASGILAAVTCYAWLLSLKKESLSFAQHQGWQLSTYKILPISEYAPEAISGLKPYGVISWYVDYCVLPLFLLFLVAIIIRSLIDIIFLKPATSLLEDPEYEYLHKGVWSPRINHLEATLAVLPPRDRTTLIRDIVLGVIDPVTPASVVSDIIDRPSSMDEVDGTTAIDLAASGRVR